MSIGAERESESEVRAGFFVEPPLANLIKPSDFEGKREGSVCVSKSQLYTCCYTVQLHTCSHTAIHFLFVYTFIQIRYTSILFIQFHSLLYTPCQSKSLHVTYPFPNTKTVFRRMVHAICIEYKLQLVHFYI